MGLIGFSSMVMTIYWDILYSPSAVCSNRDSYWFSDVFVCLSNLSNLAMS